MKFMATAIVAVVALLQLPSTAGAQPASRIRVLDGGLKTRLESGAKLSPTLRTLIAQIEVASVLVFVDCGVRMPARTGARLNFITSVNGLRYVRVEIDCSLSDRPLIALLAHELQHAWEVGNRDDILDEDSMQLYYQEFGFQSHYDGYHTSYETQAAVDIQNRVMAETARGSS